MKPYGRKRYKLSREVEQKQAKQKRKVKQVRESRA
jgi:hypothetical protein